MADETAVESAFAPSSLVEHCQYMTTHHDPTSFGTSLPGGIWASPFNTTPPSHSRTSSIDKAEEQGGVPIYRVDHKMSGDGMIFTPADDRSGTIVISQPAPQEAGEAPTCSQSLSDFCKELGERRDPTQFGTSVPGGCWGCASPPEKPLENEKEGVPIYRVEHKMNHDGFIFTPSQKSDMRPVRAGSVGSVDSDFSFSGSPAPPLYNRFDGTTMPPPPSVNLFEGRSPLPPRPPRSTSPDAKTLSEMLPSVDEAPTCCPTEEESKQADPQPTAQSAPPVETPPIAAKPVAIAHHTRTGASVRAVQEQRRSPHRINESETCDTVPKCIVM